MSVTTASGTTQYQYNYLNQRVSKTLSNGSKTLYHYDHEGRLFLETSSTGVMQAWYVYHDSGNIAAIIYGANSPYNATAQEQVLYIHSDHLGTPRIAFDSLKRVVWRWESNAFGTTTPLQDPDKDGKATLINLRFPRQYYDAETKLHYNWNRYYDPQLGRYISSDPIGLDGGLNTFGYVGQRPLGFKDPKGLFWESVSPSAYAEVGQFTNWLVNHANNDLQNQGGWDSFIWDTFASDALNTVQALDNSCYQGATMAAAMTVIKPLKAFDKLEDLRTQLRAGKEIFVNSVKEARDILDGMTELRPGPSNVMPQMRDPYNTYRGDLINTQNPTSNYIHDNIRNPNHKNNAHYNILFKNYQGEGGIKAAIIIRD